VIRQVSWSAQASDRLARALPGAVRELVAREVMSGIALLWECTDQYHSAYVVTRIDPNPTELVIVAYEGSGMMHFGPYFLQWARDRGLPVRAHVTNPLVERLLRRLKLYRSEVILRTAA